MFFRKSFDNNNVVYAPQYLSNQGILELTDMDEAFKPSSYLYFDSIEFQKITDFIDLIKERLFAKYHIEPEAKVLYENSEVGDNLIFKTIHGIFEIRIPPRTAPLDITRKCVLITGRIQNKNIVLNQPVVDIDQIILEASLIL